MYTATMTIGNSQIPAIVKNKMFAADRFVDEPICYG